MSLIVQKYGGSSLATPRHIQRAASRIKQNKLAGQDVIVVVSAMGRMTDHLIRLAHRISKIPHQRELDMLMSAGERVSMALLAMALQEEGISAISFTGSQSGILTSSDHTNAKILEIRAFRIQEEMKKGKVVIIAGFQGVSSAREITTLGRGGSDTTAVALAASLKADFCEVLTDVDGLFSADPRLVQKAKLLRECTYDEALELASLGAKMHARAIEVAKRFRVNIRICSSAEQKTQGTLISHEVKSMEKVNVRGIATKDTYTYFKTSMSFNEVIDLFSTNRVPIRFFNHSSGTGTEFLIEGDSAKVIEQKLVGATVLPKVSIVSAVGEGLSGSLDILPRFLAILQEVTPEVLLLSANSLSITAAVRTTYAKAVAERLHSELIEKDADLL